MAIYHLDAPAKVNLGLRITSRRDDGYHEIDSLFAPLDLADGIAVSVEPDDVASVKLRVEGGDHRVPLGDENLAVRAARGFLERAGLKSRVELGLTKHTPPGAGLGGGSSDAAAVLRGMTRAHPEALESGALEELALSLGADVPWFLDPRPAWVSGIGEVRCPEPGLPPLHLLLVNPGQGLPTGDVYAAYDALNAGATPPPPRRPSDLAPVLANPSALAELLHNDLEEAATRLCPAIARWRRWLESAGARAVGLSGSGATLYGLFENRAATEAAATACEAEPGSWVRVASTREWG